MKRFNLISILILLISFIGVQSVMGTERTANIVNETSAPYYAVYPNQSEKIKLNENLDVILSYPCNNVNFQITTTRFIAWGTAEIAIDATKTGNWNDTQTIHKEDYRGENQSGSQSLSTDYSKIAFKCTGGVNSDEYVHNVKFTIAPHIRLLDTTENNVTYTLIDENTINTANATLDFGKRNVKSQTEFKIKFKSFLAQTDKKFKVTLSGSDDFYFTNYDETQKQFTITETFCKLNATTGDFSITYSPQSEGASPITTITITDGTSTATITLKGEGQKIDQNLKWTANMPDQMILGESIATNGLATSDCPTAITYSSSDPTIITVTENGYLVAKQPGTATITATNTGNNQYNEKSITKEVTVTSKSLQQIVWNQSFTLLKLGDPAQTLTATVIDVTTGETIEGAQITFTSNDPNVVSINGTTLTIASLGNTTIVAETPETETHATARTIKSVYVREAKATCEGEYIINEIEPITKTTSKTADRAKIEKTIDIPEGKIGDRIEFTGTGDVESISITDKTNNKTYNISVNNNGSYTQKIDRNTKQITINITSTYNATIFTSKTIQLGNIIVHPAIYLETQTKEIVYEETKMGSNRTKYISFDYANQPDAIWGMIVDDENTEGDHSSNFTFENSELANFTSWGEGCGDINTEQLNIKFTPSTSHEGTYKAKLLVGVGENNEIKHTISLTATATKINHTLRWQEGIDNEIELNSIFNCNGKAVIVDNDNLHTIKYRYDSEYFDGLEDYPGILFAKKEGTTTIVAYIEETETCSLVEVPFEVTILPEKATMTWIQDLSNYVENTTTQTITLNATSNKEGNVIYEIISNENNIISLSGNTMTIAADKVGNAQIKAYNENYPDVFIIKNVIVASVAPCHTEIDHGINLTTGNLIVNAEKEVIHELTLEHSCKSVSFQAAITGGSMNSTSHGKITIITVVNDVEKEIFNKQFYDEGVNTSCDIDPQATKIIFKLYGYHVIGSLATTIESKLTNVKTVLASDFNNYTTDKERFDFGEFSVGASSVSKDLTISHWSLPGSINLSIESGNGKATPFSVEPAILNENCGIGEKTVTVKLNPTIGGEFTDYLVIKTGGEKVVKKIPLTATIHKQNQIISWTVESLTTADRQVQLAQSDKNTSVYYEIVSGGDYAIVENNNLGLSSVSVIKAGTFKVRAYNDDSDIYNPYSTEEKEFTSTIGTIQFDNNNGDNNWSNRANWLPINTINTQRNVEPSAVVNAVMTAEAVISNAERNEINNLTFKTGGKLTIEATSGLKANVVNGATADNLTLEASAKGNATFIYNSGTPSATVEMYSKAIQNPKPEWQYMGVAVSGATTSDFPGAWLLKWTESENTSGDPWSDEPLAAETALAPWAGYSISQPQATVYQMRGQLMNDDHTYTLTRTTREGATQDPDCGFNLLANSYTAPIDITKLTENDFVNADACIVLYNTGTYADWHSQQGNSGEQAGQLTVIPVETVGATDLPKTIPSMQAFFVMSKDGGGTFTVNYETDVLGATNMGNQMRTPEARDEFNVLKIMIEGENTRDRLYLLENESTSKEYDNGYEARKIFDAPRGHQMYATCQYGYASIDCSESFIGQTIGLKGDSEGEQLTISFDTDRLEYYNSLYLYDKATGKYVNIMAGEKYTFFGIKGTDDNRFSIVTNPDDENQTPPFVVIGEELAFDKSQIDTDNANIYIYDTSGRLLITDKINPYENYNIPNMPKGIYLVSMNGHTTKIVKK